MAGFNPGSALNPSTQVELSISCRNLQDMDVFSKSDPMCVVSFKSVESGDFFREIKRTEVISNNLNPDFVTKVNMTYHFEERQWLKFCVYDIDTKNVQKLDEQDYIGSCTTTLGQIVSNRKLCLPLLNLNNRKTGDIIITAEEIFAFRDEIVLKFSAKNLDRKDFFGWADPFLEISKSNESNEMVLVHRTEVVKWTSAPHWKQFTLTIQSLCGGDYGRNIQISCLDWNRNGKNKLIGKFHTTLRQLSNGPGEQNVYSLIHPKKRDRSTKYTNSGTVHLEVYKLVKVYSYLDYILAGTKIHCTIAIDFTASNGDPKAPQSNHYISSSPNQYEQAIAAVVEIIEDYDTDKQFPVLGFGARLPSNGQVSHEFYVNLFSTNPYCHSVQGVLDAYKKCLPQIQLYGPTNFSPVINHVTKFAQTYQDGSHYFILLIITDGVITDLPQTIQAIVYASNLPMSIIIVGVGNEDFSAMDELDADTQPLQHGGVYAARDIVQFVPFRNFQKIRNVEKAKAYLAREVLAEIPEQIVGFMKSRNIEPKLNVGEEETASPPPYSEI